MTYETLLEWVELNAERYNSEADLISGINGYNRLPNWVKNQISEIWETFHSLAEEEPEPEEPEYEESEFEEEEESLFSRFIRWIGL